ncbi:hypothetical protein K432DRAFT_285613 [Lepidopterella palustris CBS 459.81]|uniref:Zn(2)-C6 fungal-type domain-containing protein n=1 Tax=Lepidopterella palustris CBS 459.81 TaxID=1314670 RepID=A0A8E2EL38_9PEZI|nr:hypothetical protein K432DRAFT_285613 [Lepidopterella palustris CBS 459.81]
MTHSEHPGRQSREDRTGDLGVSSKSETSRLPTFFSQQLTTMDARPGAGYACERCRRQKSRCVPTDVAGLCQRCKKAGVDCVKHSDLRTKIIRPRASRSSVSAETNRMAEMEKKIERLSAIVSANAIGQSLASAHSTPQTSAHPGRLTQQISSPSPYSTPADANGIDGEDSRNWFWEHLTRSTPGLERTADATSRAISIVQIELLLENYRTMMDFFPFVTIPNEESCRDMVKGRPMLTFAMIIAASFSNPSVQAALSHDFRWFAMAKVMNGEKSLDLLQSILVFLAWQHHYMDPKAASVYMLLQICVGLVVDLGIDRDPAASQVQHPQDEQYGDRRRAYLGCYYLSCGLNIMGLDRPRNLPYANIIHQHAIDIHNAMEYPSDEVILPLIEVYRCIEDIEETFTGRYPVEKEVLHLKSQLKRLEFHWDTMRRLSVSPNDVSAKFITLNWSQMAAKIYLYKSNLSLTTQPSSSTSSPIASSAPSSAFQLYLHTSCLRAVEDFLDTALDATPDQFQYLSLVDWVSLLSALILLGKLAQDVTPVPGWDAADLLLYEKLDNYLDKLGAQMPSPSTSQPMGAPEDLFTDFRRTAAHMKATLRKPTAAPAAGHSNGLAGGFTAVNGGDAAGMVDQVAGAIPWDSFMTGF